MDPPKAAEVETKSEKTDETKGNAKSYDCGLCDTEVVYKIAQELLPGLASACVDNTTGGIFKNAGSVAVDMRKEMADYLTQRSETYVAEFLLAENTSGIELSEHPYDIVLTLIDDFAASKRNMFSRVSEWVLSDRREDRIDDFVQEMEINGFWLLPRREYIASMLLQNVDYKNAFHCNMVFSSEEQVAKHRSECKFRPMDCTNEGCTTRFCMVQKEHHEAVCPFMILPCEQKCSDFVMRREMDRHCVTICPMKLVNCAFYTVGCDASIPRCNVQQHNVDNLSSHLFYIIRAAHKEASDEDLKHRVEQILNLSNTEKLARARDARALTYLIKDAEAKLGKLEVNTKSQTAKEEKSSESTSNKKESPTKTEGEMKAEEPAKTKDDTVQPEAEGSAVKVDKVESSSSDESPMKKEEEKSKEESSNTLREEKESPKKERMSSDEEESMKDEKSKQEESTKEALEEESTKEDVNRQEAIEEEPMKDEKRQQASVSDEEETFEESSRGEEEVFTKKEDTHDSDEEAMKSPSG